MAQITPDLDMTSRWTYPIENDGWFRAHNALRADLDALGTMLSRFQAQLVKATPITRAQAAAATRFMQSFFKFLHHHHSNEDDIATPYLATRVSIPAKIAADHTQLDALLDRFEAEAKKLLAATLAAVQLRQLATVRAAFGELRPLLEDHLREEERELMPLMRRHFTPREIERNVVQKIMRSMDGEGMGTFFRPMGREERRGFARQEGIPFFIRWMLFRQAAKYERAVWQPFERLCLASA